MIRLPAALALAIALIGCAGPQKDYPALVPMDSLLARKNPAIPNDIAALRGVRFVSAVEADDGMGAGRDFIDDEGDRVLLDDGSSRHRAAGRR